MSTNQIMKSAMAEALQVMNGQSQQLNYFKTVKAIFKQQRLLWPDFQADSEFTSVQKRAQKLLLASQTYLKTH